MTARGISSTVICGVIGTGATAVYANMQKATPVPTNTQLGIGGTSTFFSAIFMMETYPRMSYPKALTYGSALTCGFYGVGAAIGAGLSLLAEARHKDV